MILEPKIINSTDSRRKQKAILERFTFTSETTDRIKKIQKQTKTLHRIENEPYSFQLTIWKGWTILLQGL